ncbi:MAG: hypothetical protein D6675_13425 [Gemmatimonadetes bacterium]|nr:MAG: hypothetical protein D6675_13425 [Gemmatimonadota bacterium]
MSIIYGKVAKILDEYTLVLNIGRKQNVKEGMTFLVYEDGDEVLDPDTGESLGKLEMVKGRVVVSHVQDRLAYATSERKETTAEEPHPAQVLSAMMARDHQEKREATENRKKLHVRPNAMSGMPRANPINVGDRVRSIEDI